MDDAIGIYGNEDLDQRETYSYTHTHARDARIRMRCHAMHAPSEARRASWSCVVPLCATRYTVYFVRFTVRFAHSTFHIFHIPACKIVHKSQVYTVY